MTGLDRGSQCPECGRIPARRRFRDTVRGQLWPPISSRHGYRRNAEAYFRRIIALLIAMECVGGILFALWWILRG